MASRRLRWQAPPRPLAPPLSHPVRCAGITMFKRMIAKQLRCPSGSIAPCVLAFIWNRRNKAPNDGALLRLRPGASDHVLEVGFGGGYLISQLLNEVTAGHVSGVDASAAMVERCSRRFAPRIEAGDLDLQCAMVDSLPYPDGRFDKATSVNALFFWPGFRQGIEEMRRVLSPTGLLVLAYTRKQDLDSRGLSSLGVRSFADDEVARTLEESGFREVLIEREYDKYRGYSIVTARR
jgi:ubiquinone/menaquinone biosynthesis C-methylase UbiE